MGMEYIIMPEQAKNIKESGRMIFGMVKEHILLVFLLRP